MKSTHCLCFTVLALAVGACVNHVPIEGRPCPCAEDQGYTCCATTNQCLPAGQVCQADAGATTDGEIAPVWTDAGQSKWQAIASVSSDWISTPSQPLVMGDRVTFREAYNETGRALTYRFAQNDWLQQAGHWPEEAYETGVGLVWTGSQVVYWGGVVNTTGPVSVVNPTGSEFVCSNLGGLYSPATDTWSAINTNGAPSLAVDGGGFTGSEVVLRGSSCLPQQSGDPVPGPVIGALYNPATDTWRNMSTVNAPTTTNGTDVVLGEKVVCWGGAPYVAGQTYGQSPTQPSELTNSGAVYNATDDTWTAMSTTNAPSPRSGMVALAMRGKMFIWGGTDGTTNSLGEQNYFHDGGIFDPETNTWTPINSEGSPPTYNGWSGLWAEEQGLAYVWAFIWTPGVGFPAIALSTYDPSADRWASIDVTGLPRNVWNFVWTGRDLLAIGELAGDSTTTPSTTTGAEPAARHSTDAGGDSPTTPPTTMGGFRYTP